MSNDPDRLRISEIFLSIQGESTYAGLPCVFVRTSGCPLRCRWCDTRYADDHWREMSVDEVAAEALSFGVPLIEVTGGEPLQQPATLPLMTRLCDAASVDTVLLETSGALDIAPVDPRVVVIMDVKCPDSGVARHNRLENLALLRPGDQVKFVVASRADYEFARRVIAEHRLDGRCQLLLGCAHGEIEPRTVAQWMLADRLPVRLQLQLQKQIWPTTARGV